jgi:ATP-binding cassette, subfamily C (CFTR/MRP), member 1
MSATVAVLGFVLWMLECIGPEHGPGAYHPIGKDVNESPFNTANAYSRWTFYWMGDLMKLGAKRPLEEDDVYALGKEDQSEVLTEKLERATEKHSNLWVALGAAYGSTYAEAAVLKIIQDILAFAQPQFLRWFLAYISLYQAATSGPTGNPKSPSAFKGFAIVTGMFVCATVQTIVLHQVSTIDRNV